LRDRQVGDRGAEFWSPNRKSGVRVLPAPLAFAIAKQSEIPAKPLVMRRFRQPPKGGRKPHGPANDCPRFARTPGADHGHPSAYLGMGNGFFSAKAPAIGVE